MPVGGIITLVAFVLGCVAVLVLLLIDNAKKKPDYKLSVGPLQIGVKAVDGAAVPQGLHGYLNAVWRVLCIQHDEEVAKRVLDGDVWVYGLDAPELSPRLVGKNYTGTIHDVDLWGGLAKRRTVRIRNLERGDIRTTALGHEYAWHLVPLETGQGWNRSHALDMQALEDRFKVAYAAAQ